MNLPLESHYHLLKGTWFVWNADLETIHIHLKNNGRQLIYYNGNLVSDKRVLKLKSEHLIDADQGHYRINVFPTNARLTSCTTELRKDENLLRTFTFTYTKSWKRYLVMFLTGIVITIPLFLLQVNEYIVFTVLMFFILIYVLLNAKQMMKITEEDNPITFDI